MLGAILGLTIAILVFGTLGLAVLFTWLTNHQFKKHQDFWIAFLVSAGLLGFMGIIALIL